MTDKILNPSKNTALEAIKRLSAFPFAERGQKNKK